MDKPNVSPGDWIRIGNIEAVVCQVCPDDIEVVFLSGGSSKTTNQNARWSTTIGSLTPHLAAMPTIIHDWDNSGLFCIGVVNTNEVCTNCGEKMHEFGVTDELLRFAHDEFKPVKTVEVPVFDFAERT